LSDGEFCKSGRRSSSAGNRFTESIQSANGSRLAKNASHGRARTRPRDAVSHANTNPATGDRGARQEFQHRRIVASCLNSHLRDATQAPPLRAELIGSDECSIAAGITARGSAPILKLCRKLIQAGIDPNRPLHVYRGDVLAIVVRTIGDGARLTVKERPFGPVFERWMPFSTPPVSLPIRQNGSAAHEPREPFTFELIGDVAARLLDRIAPLHRRRTAP
jgi:hypothetical protein